ncbi:hypothetical protein Ahy_A02g008952 isoform B [Arachis hypogaea]|uniref:Uncharacterized protein n=1 Tax=Arachis hypogaea TaxID=3818 RepID=A0A445EFK4_ARAHY|nr:hypothetical protein Ahy_A02g008952 isoform B [Arachis hypogaea]
MFLTLWTPPSPQNHLASRSDPSEAKFGSPFSQINHDARLLRTIGLAKQKEGLYYLIVNAMKDKPTTTLATFQVLAVERAEDVQCMMRKRLRKMSVDIRNEGSPTDWISDEILAQLRQYWAMEEYGDTKSKSNTEESLHTCGSTTYESKHLKRAHTRKEDRRFEENMVKATDERATQIAARVIESPSI